MNPDNCVIDMSTKTVRTDIDFTRFLYIEWNSEQTRGGAGLGHILYSICSLLNYYIRNERHHRTIIFSDQWRPDWERHSPKSQKTTVDIREYYEIGPIIGTKLGQKIKVYFDYKGIFRDTFSTNEIVGIASIPRRQGTGLTKVRENNKNIFEVEELNENQLLKYNYNFWCGGWHTGGVPAGENPLDKHEVDINCWGCYRVNTTLKTKARNIIEYIKQQSENKNAPFYVMHLRRGDRLVDNGISGSSEIDFITNQLKTNFVKGSSIYVMTNGTEEYITKLKKELQDTFAVFTKLDFSDLKEMGDEDNFALFSLENEICDLSNRKITNRDYLYHTERVFSLIFEYTNRPLECIITLTGDVLVKVGKERETYTTRIRVPHTFAFGVDGNYVYKENVIGQITFNNPTFQEDPAPGKAKFGFIKLGNEKQLIKIGEENSVYSSDAFYSAIYGKDGKFYCKLNVKGQTQFNDSSFGVSFSEHKKESYILLEPFKQ